MSDFSMAIKLSEEKAKRYVDRFNAIKQDTYAKSLVFNAYYQGHLDAGCDEHTLQKKYEFLLIERNKLLEENARLRDKLNGKDPVKEVLKTPEPKHVLFI